jgi:flagellar protein FlgJ
MTTGAVELGLFRRMAEPHRAAEAARQFEALLIEHLLKTTRQSAQPDAEAGALSGSDTYLEIAEQQLARALAERGGLGIAKMILADIRAPGVSADKSKEGHR